jgi:hypothetical protein
VNKNPPGQVMQYCVRMCFQHQQRLSAQLVIFLPAAAAAGC